MMFYVAAILLFTSFMWYYFWNKRERVPASDTISAPASDTISAPNKRCMPQKRRQEMMPPPIDMNNPIAKMIMSNPEMMLNMMPEGTEKEQIKSMLSVPGFREMMTNPDMLKHMMVKED